MKTLANVAIYCNASKGLATVAVRRRAVGYKSHLILSLNFRLNALNGCFLSALSRLLYDLRILNKIFPYHLTYYQSVSYVATSGKHKQL